MSTALFPSWDPAKHLIDPFEIPSGWTLLRSLDWGHASPASLGIWAVSDGLPVAALDGFVFPKGSLVRINEWHVIAQDPLGNPIRGRGACLSNEVLGAGIGGMCHLMKSLGFRFSLGVADPSIFSERSPGRSIYTELVAGARRHGYKIGFQPAVNQRLIGWTVVDLMLNNAAQDVPAAPGLWSLKSLDHFAHAMSSAFADPNCPGDVLSPCDDSVIDEVRYACMAVDLGSNSSDQDLAA